MGTDYDDQSDNFSIVDHLVWHGTVNTTWDNQNNWANAIVPDNSHPIMIPDTAINFTVIGVNTVSYGKELTIMLGAEFEVLSGGLLDITGPIESYWSKNIDKHKGE